MSDMDKLKENMRLAISVRRCPDDACCGEDVGNGLCQCEVDAIAALTAIESAGYIIMPKDEIVKQVAGIRFRENADG